MTVTPTELAKKYAPWSNSKIDCIKQCPYQFHQKYIVKKKLPSNIDARIGQAVHRALEFVLSGRTLDASLKFAAEEQQFTGTELERFNTFTTQIQRFFKKANTYKRKHNTSMWKMEQRLAVDWECKPLPFFNNNGFLRGVVDLYCTKKEGSEIIIIDHKTGKMNDFRYYQQAFQIYVVLLKAQLPLAKRAKIGINYVKHDSVVFSKNVYDLQDTQYIIDNLIMTLNEITANVDFQEQRVGRLCAWCDYSDECPAYMDEDDKNAKTKESTPEQGTTMENMGTNR